MAARGRLAKIKHELAKLAFVIGLMALMLVLFGAMTALVESQGWDHVWIIAVAVFACGLYSVLISIKFRRVAGRGRFNVPGIIFGMSLMCGAALYRAFQDATSFFLCLFIPILIGGFIACIKDAIKRRNKTS